METPTAESTPLLRVGTSSPLSSTSATSLLPLLGDIFVSVFSLLLLLPIPILALTLSATTYTLQAATFLTVSFVLLLPPLTLLPPPLPTPRKIATLLKTLATAAIATPLLLIPSFAITLLATTISTLLVATPVVLSFVAAYPASFAKLVGDVGEIIEGAVLDMVLPKLPGVLAGLLNGIGGGGGPRSFRDVWVDVLKAGVKGTVLKWYVLVLVVIAVVFVVGGNVVALGVNASWLMARWVRKGMRQYGYGIGGGGRQVRIEGGASSVGDGGVREEGDDGVSGNEGVSGSGGEEERGQGQGVRMDGNDGDSVGGLCVVATCCGVTVTGVLLSVLGTTTFLNVLHNLAVASASLSAARGGKAMHGATINTITLPLKTVTGTALHIPLAAIGDLFCSAVTTITLLYSAGIASGGAGRMRRRRRKEGGWGVWRWWVGVLVGVLVGVGGRLVVPVVWGVPVVIGGVWMGAVVLGVRALVAGVVLACLFVFDRRAMAWVL